MVVLVGWPSHFGTLQASPMHGPSGISFGMSPPIMMPPLPVAFEPPVAPVPPAVAVVPAVVVPGLMTLSLPAGEQENTNEATDTIEPRTAVRRMLVALIRFFMAKPGL